MIGVADSGGTRVLTGEPPGDGADPPVAEVEQVACDGPAPGEVVGQHGVGAQVVR